MMTESQWQGANDNNSLWYSCVAYKKNSNNESIDYSKCVNERMNDDDDDNDNYLQQGNHT